MILAPDALTTVERPDPNKLYWVLVEPGKWAKWPHWRCRRSGIDPNGLIEV